MNERIENLIDASGLTSVYDMFEPELLKFAQLIIQECARTARATPCPYNDEEIKRVFGHTWDIAALAAGRNINDYFGVK